MIKEVTLGRFKRFDGETFDLHGHVILVGPNNTGKTTVLQAIATWALALRKWKEANNFKRSGRGPSYSSVAMSRAAFSSVSLRSFDLLWKDRDYRSKVEITVVMEDAPAVTMQLWKDSSDQIYITPDPTVEPAVLKRVDPQVVYLSTVSGLSVEEPVYQADYIETVMGRQRPGEVVRNLLHQASRGTRWAELCAAVDRLFGVELMIPSTPGGTILCEYRQSPTSPSFDLLSAGSGFQQVVMLLAALFTRTGSVILVDEPDAHLHVFLQDTIFSELRKAAAASKSQLIIATHSEVIFSSADPEQICALVGTPKRLVGGESVQKLKQAMVVLQQSDLVLALAAPGIMYLEGHTDLNLLREWARVLGHPLTTYLQRSPFWRPVVASAGLDVKGVKAQDHFKALQLVKEDVTGVWLLDADNKRVEVSARPEHGAFNRIAWTRYEAESYLLHPAALARFIQAELNIDGEASVLEFFIREFGLDQTEKWYSDPLAPPPLIESYFQTKKARTVIVAALIENAGIHGMSHTDYDRIAALMLPSEVHPEVKKKLDFIQQAFGL